MNSQQHISPKAAHRWQAAAMLACLLFLSACGGGGNNNPDPPRPPPPPPNAAPNADAGADQNTNPEQTVTLNGAGSSDPEGSQLRYAWRQTSGPTVPLSNANGERTTFSAPSVTENTILSFSLTVTDADGLTDNDTISITVLAPPRTHPEGARIVSTPQAGDTYGASETIMVEVAFPDTVNVDGTPTLTLTIGAQTRQARYVRGSGTPTLVFSYVVQEDDDEADSIEIGALSGGTITDADDRPVALEPEDDTRVDIKIDGNVNRVATVTEVQIESVPQTGDVYRAGETIRVRVGFSEVVEITGATAPTLALTVGTQTRPAAYASGSDTTTLTFEYTVQSSDDDDDGITIAADALQPDGSVVDIGKLPANLDLNTYAITDAESHKVIGRDRAGVSGVRITSTPRTAGASAYGLGEKIVVAVDFSRAVNVTDTPTLTLNVGTQDRPAAFEAGSGTATLTFGYTVQNGDDDADGITIAANALQRGGGGIADTEGLYVNLGLGTHAIANASGHAVAGRDKASITGVRVTSTPRAGDTYTLGEKIVVTVTFTHPVNVTPAPTPTRVPTIPFLVGGHGRSATYESGSGTAMLTFGYTVQDDDTDDDGIAIAPNSLQLNGSSIDDLQLGAANITFQADAITVPNHAIIGREPISVTGVRITSAPAAGTSAYGLGAKIVVEVDFSQAVNVIPPPAPTLAPTLTLNIGTQTQPATFEAGSGSTTLTFGYTVQSGDDDDDGISIAANALQHGGGGIADTGGLLANLNLNSHAIDNAPGHAVAGRMRASVSDVRVTSTPRAGGIYTLGEKIVVTVTFTHPVNVTGAPTLPFLVGGHAQTAAYESGTGTAALTFGYTVQSGDGDGTDGGISIAPNSLQLSGGGINDLQLGAADITFQAGVITAPSHVVIGREPISVSGVRITSAPNAGASAYGLGAKIVVAVDFPQAVDVIDTPTLTLNIGIQTRPATFEAGSGSTTLSFGYTVQSGDADDDGISIAAGALQLNGSSIDDTGGLYVNLGLGTHAIANASGHAVAGRASANVSGVRITSTPNALNSYGIGEKITVAVDFSHAVNVTGSPTLTLSFIHNLTNFTRTRQAAYESGNGTATLTFGYTVVLNDSDNNGISIAADALQLNGGGINDPQLGPADLNLGSHAIANAANHQVVGRAPASVVALWISSTPRHGNTFGQGEVINVTVSFSTSVLVTGSPTLTLTIGMQSPAASFDRHNSNNLHFTYTVQSGDTDDDGIDIAANALQLNGGTILDAELGEPTNLVLSDSALAVIRTTTRNVTGRERARISGVRITSTPSAADTYDTGEQITVAVDFSHAVNASGLAATPQPRPPSLLLHIGDIATGSRLADYVSGDGTTTFIFAYTVQDSDTDTDGISIPDNALQLSGETIDDPDLGPVDLLLGSHVITNASAHKVSGGTATRVSGVRITSTPRQGSSYGANETITVAVTFSRTVIVSGAPTLTLTMDTQPQTATFLGGSRTATLTFTYTVQSTDTDDDGISIAADALQLNGGSITDEVPSLARLDLGTHAITNASGHQVDGSVTHSAVSISAVNITSTPITGSTYGATEVISVEVVFSGSVRLGSISTDFPVLNLTIGLQTQEASFEGVRNAPPRLAFEYTVQSTDVDTDGIGIAADALNLGSGGTLIDLADGTTTVSSSLGDHAIDNASGHQVDGSVDRIATVTGVTIISNPDHGDTYDAGEQIMVRVTFSETVTAAGGVSTGPRLMLTVGSNPRPALLRATGNTLRRLEFDYSVISTDSDSNGISIAADALQLGTDGTIIDAGGQPANLGLGTLTISDAADHKVDGALDTPPRADAGDDERVATATVVTLDGSGSTDDETSTDDLTYAWTQLCGPTVTLSDPTTAMPTFTASTYNVGGDASDAELIPELPTGVTPFAAYTTHTFELTVTDAQGNADTDTVTVTAIPTSTAVSAGGFTPNSFTAANLLENQCASPRSGLDPDGESETQGTALNERQWLRSFVHERYFWYDEVVDQNPALYTDLDTYFDLRKTFAEASSCGKPKDEFHFTTRVAAAPGTSAGPAVGEAGFGAQFGRFGHELLVQFVQPNSPAGLAELRNADGDVVATGLRRGDRLMRVDDIDTRSYYDLNEVELAAVLAAILDNDSVGVTHTYEFLRGEDGILNPGQRLTTTITTALFEVDPVPSYRVVDVGTEKIGYLHFIDHTQSAEAELADAIEFFNGQGIDDLVLDIRYNLGGFLAIALRLATMIANPSATDGQVYERLIYRDTHPSRNRGPDFFNSRRRWSSPVGGELPNLGLNRLFVLTTNITCSASESLINGLRGIDIEVIQIGRTTCGKPYGTSSPENCGIRYSFTEFIGVNAKGFGDYQHGFTPELNSSHRNIHEKSVRLPGCYAFDNDFEDQLGDADEKLFETALAYRASLGSPGGPSCTIPSPSSGSSPRGLVEIGTEEDHRLLKRTRPPGSGKIIAPQ